MTVEPKRNTCKHSAILTGIMASYSTTYGQCLECQELVEVERNWYETE